MKMLVLAVTVFIVSFSIVGCSGSYKYYSWGKLIQEENNKMRLVTNNHKGKPYENIKYVKFSPDSMSVAYIVKQDGKLQMVVDNVETAYQDVEENSITFSPKGKRIVFIAKRDGAWYVTVDGKEQVQLESYDEIDASKFNLQFSPNEERLSYVVSKHNNKQLHGEIAWVLITDGKEDGNYYNNILSSKFSPDNKHVVYVGQKGEEDGKWVVVTDGVEDKIKMDDFMNFTPIFSPDSKHISYGAKINEQWFMVLDGKLTLGIASTDLGFPVFSQSCDSIGYMAVVNKKWNMVVNDKIIEDYLPKHTASNDLWWIKSIENYFSIKSDKRCPILINTIKGSNDLVRKVNTHYMFYPSGFFDIEKYGISKLEIGANHITVSYSESFLERIFEDLKKRNIDFYFDALPGHTYALKTSDNGYEFIASQYLREKYMGIVDITESIIK